MRGEASIRSESCPRRQVPLCVKCFGKQPQLLANPFRKGSFHGADSTSEKEVPQVGNSFHRERFNLLDLIERKIFATAKSLLATAKYYLH